MTREHLRAAGSTASARLRSLAILTAAAVGLGGLQATAAVAADPVLPTDATLAGVIRVLPDEEGMISPTGTRETENIVTVITPEGTAVEVTGADVAAAESGAVFEGTVAVPDEIAEEVGPAPEAELGELVATASAEQDLPLTVIDAVITPATQAAAAAQAHTIDVMYVDVPGSATPAASDIDDVVSRLSEYWTSESGGQITSITRTNPIRFGTRSAAQLCDPNELWEWAAGPAGFGREPVHTQDLPSDHYWAGGTAAHLLVVVPGSVCGEGNGLGSLGSVHAGGVSWASVSDTDTTEWDQVVFHEIGHNLGLGHSNVTSCALPVVDGPSCAQAEYRDYFDVMGGGYFYGDTTNFANIAALNASQKANLDALPRSGAAPGLVTVTAAGGLTQEFTLRAASASHGLRALRVVDPRSGAVYFVEYRSGGGRDALSFYGRIGRTESAYAPGVRILKLDCPTVGGGCAGAASTVLRNASTGGLSLSAGEGFTSPDALGRTAPGTRVDVVSTGGDEAVVRVDYGVEVAPRVYGVATITGTARVGATLTGSLGAPEAGVSYTYQWFSRGSAIAGATGPTYTPVASDRGATITVRISASAAGYLPATYQSAATAAVGFGILTPTTPTIGGAVKVGATLTASTSGWGPSAQLGYQWRVNGAAIAGATARTYAVRIGDVGKTVTVAVTGRRDGYTTLTTVSKATGKVPAVALSSRTPTISGAAKVGVTLRAAPGAWTSGTRFSYQWLVSGKAVAGATKSTFTPSSAHVGRTVTVRVTGSKAGHTTVAKTSRGTAKVAKGTIRASAPKVTGTVKVGATVRVSPAEVSGARMTYQWYVSGKAVKGATKSTFTLRAADRRKSVTVRVSYTKAGYTTARVMSAKKTVR